MSKYTTELRYICEHQAGLDESEGYLSIDEILKKARPIIFSFSYPIFNEEYREPLETKILKYYYTREICCETYGRWKLFLDSRMNEIMPYYNKLYESELLQFDPLHDVDLYRESTRNTSEESEGTSETTGSSSVTTDEARNEHSLFSDTPQGGLTGIDNNTYLTNATRDTADNSTEQTGTNSNETSTTGSASGTDEFLEHVYGKQGSGSYAKIIKELRETFLNIDQMVINDLDCLFFGLW